MTVCGCALSQRELSQLLLINKGNEVFKFTLFVTGHIL